jgi:hypothetical protein
MGHGMKRSGRFSTPLTLVLLAAWASGGPAAAQDEFPPTTPEGLERVDSRRLDVVYWRHGATLAPYKRIALLDCSVAFRKNWEHEQEARRSVYKADAEDMERIRGLLAEEFRAVFTRELHELGGYEIVDAAGDDVLMLRPSIVDLDVAAPVIDDVPGIVVNYVASAGEMTLHLELFDSATNSLIGRVIDRAQGSEVKQFLISDAVTNRAEADRILQEWAQTLRAALDERWSGGQ